MVLTRGALRAGWGFPIPVENLFYFAVRPVLIVHTRLHSKRYELKGLFQNRIKTGRDNGINRIPIKSRHILKIPLSRLFFFGLFPSERVLSRR